MIGITIKTLTNMTDSMKKCIRNRPIIGHFLYKYFGVETNSYKSWWEEYTYQMQYELNNQQKYLKKYLVS
jgi:hypothetical protein